MRTAGRAGGKFYCHTPRRYDIVIRIAVPIYRAFMKFFFIADRSAEMGRDRKRRFFL